jgi:hypothetical protein
MELIIIVFLIGLLLHNIVYIKELHMKIKWLEDDLLAMRKHLVNEKD